MIEQLEMFPEPERQIEMFEPEPGAEPEAAPKERKRLKLIRLDDPRRPRNRARRNNPEANR